MGQDEERVCACVHLLFYCFFEKTDGILMFYSDLTCCRMNAF